MRSDSNFPVLEDTFFVRAPTLSAMEIEQKARAYRARVVGELLADVIVWVTRLPRRLAESIDLGGRRQRV